MPWLRTPDHTRIIHDLRDRVSQLRQLAFRHEQQIARLEEQQERTTVEPGPRSDRLDTYLSNVLPMLVLGGVAGAIAVVAFFTIGSVRTQLLIALALAVGVAALVAVHWVGRRLALEHETVTQRVRDRRLALGLYVVGIISLMVSTVLIALD